MKTVKWTLCSMIVCAVIVTFQMTALAADTDALVVDETGNVGIGTDQPRSRIHAVDSGNQTTSFTGLNSGTLSLYGGSYVEDGYTNLDFSNNGTGSVIGRIGVRNNGQGSYLTLGTSNQYSDGITNEALIIDPWGKVGIGTINPGATLDVAGNIQATYISVSGNVGIGTTTPATRLELKAGGNADIRLTNTNDGNYWELNTRNSGRFDIVREGLAEVISFDTNGNVGIGTTSPGTKLHINGSVRGHQNGALNIDTGNGYVSIGPRNASWSHFYTDRERYYFNKEIRVDSGNISSFDEDLNLGTSGTNRITVLASNGNVGIGTASPSEKLHVAGNLYTDGSINCYELTTRYVGGGGGADFVFKEDYDLPALSDVKAFIQKNKHLPEIPSAAEMQTNGVSVPEMLTKHLQKIEELTLYMIELKSDNTKLQSENGDLRKLVQRLEGRLSKLENQAEENEQMNN